MFQIKKNNYTFTFLTFLIDVISEPFIGFYFLETTLSYLIITSLFRFNKNHIIWTLFLLSIKSLLKYGHFGLNIGPLLLLIFFIYNTRAFFSNPISMATVYMIIFLIFQTFILNGLILGYKVNFIYTIIYIMINGLITYTMAKVLIPSIQEKSLTI